jgi:hypothetical protein
MNPAADRAVPDHRRLAEGDIRELRQDNGFGHVRYSQAAIIALGLLPNRTLGQMVAHSENGDHFSWGAGCLKAQRCFGFKPTVVPTFR